MTYAATETAVQSGKPVELYELLNGTAAFRYTSADSDVVYAGNTYEAVPIARGAIEATQEMFRAALNLTCATDLGVLDLFRFTPPEEVVTMTLRRLHQGDGEAITMWTGRVLNVTWNNASVELHCESVYASLKRNGLRRLYQRPCPHVLYGPGCTLNRATWKATKTVASVSGISIVLNDMGSYVDGYFSGGYLEWESSTGIFERRAIRAQTGGTITINFAVTGLAVAATVGIYPGCDHTLSTCGTKFSNSLNYGGIPHFTGKNPFNGATLY